MAASVEVVKPRGQYDEVVVHPLVLLSVVDHFRRVEEVRAPPRRADLNRVPSPVRWLTFPRPSPPSLQDDSEDKRVVGVLLGEYRKGRLDVTSSFAGECLMSSDP